jgi:SnoaL-like domain
VRDDGSRISLATRLAVEDLLTEFAARVDDGRGDSVHELFIEAGEIETPAFKLTGRAAIQQRFAARARDTTRKTRHFWSNPQFAGDESRITVTTNVMTVVNAEGKTSLTGGTSLDVVVPSPDGFVFARRRLEVAFDGQLLAREPQP